MQDGGAVTAKKNYKQLLKPCPFCGSIPKVETECKWVEHQHDPVMIIQQRVKISCDRCFLEKDIVAISYAICGLDDKAYKTVARKSARDVIDRMWNERYDAK